VKAPLTLALVVLFPTVLVPDEARADDADGPDSSQADDPDRAVARPDAADLRHGHWLLSVDGGVWAPSMGIYPTIPEIGVIDAGGTLHGHVGVGLGRYLVLNVDGGFAYGPSTNSATDCSSCGLWSIDVGPSLAFHLTQGFAFDPWVSYGLGYRHTILSLDSGNEPVKAVDVAKLAIGGDWYPDPLFGLGPYIGTDIGVRTSGEVSGYGIFHAGLRLTFDPLGSGTSFTPGVAAR
jgi:hypothetical protein